MTAEDRSGRPVTVFGPSGQEHDVVLPDDVPLGELFGSLGEAAGVWPVTSVILRGGGILQPGESLAAAGVPAGAALIVNGRPGPPPGPVRVATPRPAGASAGVLAPRSSGARSRPGPWAWASVALVVGLVVGGVIGALAFGGSGTASSAWSTAQAQLAAASVRTWLAGAGGPAGRQGPAVAATFQPVGSPQAAGDGLRAQRYLVLPGHGPAFGLTAVMSGSESRPALACPLGYSGTQFGTGNVPEGGRSVSAAGLGGVVTGWAASTVGPAGTLTRLLGVGQDGLARILAATAPRGGALKAVLRVEVPLASDAPGTLAAGAQGAARTDGQAAAAAQQKVNQDQNALNQANAAAAQQAAANNPLGFLAAQAQVAQATSTLQVDQSNLRAAQLRAAASAVQAKDLAGAASHVEATYDLAVNQRNQVVAWAPAGA